jgi:hypothetical protein
MPPPKVLTCAPVTVRLEIAAVTPPSTANTLKFDAAPPPLIKSALAPGLQHACVEDSGGCLAVLLDHLEDRESPLAITSFQFPCRGESSAGADCAMLALVPINIIDRAKAGAFLIRTWIAPRT